MQIDGVKVFSATMQRKRDELGDGITRWIQDNRDKEIVDVIVTQSSDAEFHCVTITLFWRRRRSSADRPGRRPIYGTGKARMVE